MQIQLVYCHSHFCREAWLCLTYSTRKASLQSWSIHSPVKPTILQARTAPIGKKNHKECKKALLMHFVVCAAEEFKGRGVNREKTMVSHSFRLLLLYENIQYSPIKILQCKAQGIHGCNSIAAFPLDKTVVKYSM